MRKAWERPAAMVGHMVNGRYRKAQLSAMQIARLRKTAMLEGRVFIGADYTKGEWDPRWEKQKKPVILKPLRGRLGLRNREQRMEKIKQALDTMDDRIKERSKKGTIPTPFLEKIFLQEGLVIAPKKKN